MIKILIPFLVACGSSSMTMPPATDAPLAGDAQLPQPRTLVEVMLDCVDYTREVRNAATDNSRELTINSYATVDIAPGADFVLSRCDAPIEPTCQSGDVCSGSDHPPVTKICDVKRGTATGADAFYDSKLTILCGQRFERYTGSGTLADSTQSTFTVKLEIFQ